MVFTTRHPTATTLIGTIVLVLGAGTTALVTLSHRESLTNDRFCVSCHPSDVHASLGIGGHELSCASCHASTRLDAAVLGLARLVGARGMDATHGEVPDAGCVSCHVDGREEEGLIGRSPGHLAHLRPPARARAEAGLHCVRCHHASGSRPDALDCRSSGCHELVRDRLGDMVLESDVECMVCHEFTSAPHAPAFAATGDHPARPPMDALFETGRRPHEACLGCHAGQRRTDVAFVGDLAHGGLCAACHDPHRDTDPVDAWRSCAGLGCHASASRESAFHRGLAPDVLPDCSRCHEHHTWFAAGGDCAACHAPSALVPGAVFSHARHTELGCERCHRGAGESGTHGELRVWQREDCMACHASHHRPEASCRSCHPAARVAGHTDAAHAGCSGTGCHTTTVLAQLRPTRPVCLVCHQDRVDHEVEDSCVDCHDVEGFPSAASGD